MNAFDPLLLSQVRLGIITLLLSQGEMTFSELKGHLELTQGNLGTHIGKLEDAKYIKVTKNFVAKKPQTRCRLTAKGKAAFLRHVDELKRIAGDV